MRSYIYVAFSVKWRLCMIGVGVTEVPGLIHLAYCELVAGSAQPITAQTVCDRKLVLAQRPKSATSPACCGRRMNCRLLLTS
jgi:hypothetical protein